MSAFSLREEFHFKGNVGNMLFKKHILQIFFICLLEAKQATPLTIASILKLTTYVHLNYHFMNSYTYTDYSRFNPLWIIYVCVFKLYLCVA